MVGAVLKKGIVLVILVLFLGIAVNPSLASIVMTSASENEVTVEVELCGIEKLGDYGSIDTNYEVRLTKEQAQFLHHLIARVKQKINDCTHREDAVHVLNNAVSSLRELGVLRNDMSVDEAQALVTSMDDARLKEGLSASFEHTIDMLDEHNMLPKEVSSEDAKQISKNAVDALFAKKDDVSALNKGGNWNVLCFVTGETTETSSAGPLYYAHLGAFTITMVLLLLLNPFYWLSAFMPYPLGLLSDAIDYFLTLFFLSAMGNAYYSNLNQYPLGHVIGVGTTHGMEGVFLEHHPAKGWINTIGLLGNKTCEGKMYGQLPFIVPPAFGLDSYHPGILGFTGIKVIQKEYPVNKQFYMGTALVAKIGHGR